MWTTVLKRQSDRHAELVDRTEDDPANDVIRSQLLRNMPWMVEPTLLKDLAAVDLDGFHTAVLTTDLCRELRDGASIEAVRNRFANRIDQLSSRGRRLVEMYFDEGVMDPKWGCNEATRWASRAVEGNWRLILNPAEAKPHYGEPYSWRASSTDLGILGRTFAETTVSALMMWEPDSDRLAGDAPLLRWVAEVLTHLPRISDDVKDVVRPIVESAREAVRASSFSVRYHHTDRGTLEKLVARIEKIAAEPAPDISSRRSALGDPAQVTRRELAEVPADVLISYLDRHTGDDLLIEKALLAVASLPNPGPRPQFGDVLGRHSDPDAAVLGLTYDLRRRLGGNPPAREQWAREVLALPNCAPNVIRALPAWTALKLSNGYGSAYPEIIDVVTNVLGDETASWKRLAASPISYTGPAAWLRLGDVLDAARSGTDWPPPPSR
ncbi:hypothetical protein [Nocardia sp. NPDC004860]|uniref:hypothetical protein n=1 Tax=Nocardia sp. NPDC004860 TaxID=3154557 RepID=UPI0033B38C10